MVGELVEPLPFVRLRDQRSTHSHRSNKVAFGRVGSPLAHRHVLPSIRVKLRRKQRHCKEFRIPFRECF